MAIRFGTFFDDELIGTDDVDFIFGLTGDDRIEGLGGDDWIFAGFGADTVLGGLGDDHIFGESGNDMLDGGEGDDQIDGGNGNDIILGGAGDDELVGGTGMDQLFGGIGNDRLDGGADADMLDAGDGFDVLVGGAGDDALHGGVNDDILAGGAGDDVLDGGTGGVVTLVGQGRLPGDPIEAHPLYGQAVHIFAGGSEGDTADYSDAPGPVSVDLATGIASDGEGGTDALIGIEVVRGSAFDDTLTGGAGTDFLAGNAGNDTIDGGPGFDFAMYQNDPAGITATLSAGSGTVTDGYGDTDTLTSIEAIYGTRFDDQLTGGLGFQRFRGNAGDDMIDGGADFDEIDYLFDNAGVTVNFATGVANDGFGNIDTISNVEFVRGSLFDDTFIGSGAAFERYRPMAGDDFVDGGAGFDRVDYTFDPQAVTVNLAGGLALDGYGGTDTLVNVESVSGSLEADVLIGNANFNSLLGQAGDDTLAGLGSSDFLDGGAGSDTIDYSLDATFGGTAGVTVDLASGLAVDGFGSFDTIMNAENVRGTDFADHLTGNAGDNTLEGLGGDDTIVGGNGAGNDTYAGGTGDDTVTYASTALGVTVDLSAGTATGPEIGSDTLTGLENVIGGAGNDTVTGDSNDNRLAGLAGVDTLDGGDGFDVLEGGDGDDALHGGVNDDILVGGAGDDVLDGGTGGVVTLVGQGRLPGDPIESHPLFGQAVHIFAGGSEGDTADYSDAPGPVSVDLATGIASDGEGGTDTLIGIEVVRGSAFDDTLTGGPAGGFLAGNAGNDTINGGLGFDFAMYQNDPAGITANISAAGGTVIDGYGGTDTLTGIEAIYGTQFDDQFTGGFGFQRFRGNAGDDLIDGGADFDEIDYLFDNAGVTVNFATGVANDGFGGTDTIANIEAVRGSLFDDTFIGSAAPFERYRPMAGDDVVDGGGGFDQISYVFDPIGVTVDLSAGTASDGYGGTDTLVGIEQAVGSANDDTLRGDSGGNGLFGIGGSDTLNGRAGNDFLDGGAGDDLFVFENGTGNDTVQGFVAGMATDDIMDVTAFGFANFAAVQAATTQVGTDTVIQLDVDDSVTLLGVNAADLHADDFLI